MRQRGSALLQRQAAREDDLWQKGQEQAQQALGSLLKLQEDLPYSVGWSRGNDDEREKRSDVELENLGRSVILLTGQMVRRSMELAHVILREADDICQWGDVTFSSQQIVFVASRYGIETISAYLRGETYAEELPDNVKQLKKEAYAKPSLKKYRPMAARNEDRNVLSGLL